MLPGFEIFKFFASGHLNSITDGYKALLEIYFARAKFHFIDWISQHSNFFIVRLGTKLANGEIPFFLFIQV